jgi:hypothetical protein
MHRFLSSLSLIFYSAKKQISASSSRLQGRLCRSSYVTAVTLQLFLLSPFMRIISMGVPRISVNQMIGVICVEGFIFINFAGSGP